MKTRFAFLFLLAALLSGCGFGRYWISDPEQNRVIRVENGDRYYFNLKEPEADGMRWSAKCDDPDVEVLVDHDDGEADVRIRIHRGFDGPANVIFTLKRPRSREAAKTFTVSCYRKTGDSAFWK